MAYEKSEFAELLERERVRKSPEVLESTLRALHLAERGEVSASILTGDPNWDSFCQILQGQANRSRELRAAILEKLGSMWNAPTERERLCAEALKLSTIIEVLEKVIEVPKVLREDGARARDALRLVE